jgi:hypothetical protein
VVNQPERHNAGGSGYDATDAESIDMGHSALFHGQHFDFNDRYYRF